MNTGIHVELAVSACEGCPVSALSSRTAVEELRIDSVDDRVEFVAADLPEDPPTALDLVEFGGRAHGRYEIACERPATDGGVAVGASGVDGSAAAAPDAETGGDPETPGPDTEVTEAGEDVCAGCSCGGLPAAFANFPASPRRTEMVDGVIHVSFVLSGHEELQAIVDECEAAGLDVTLRRLCVDRGGDEDPGSDVVPVDLAGVTDRQAEIATVAAESGYFEPGGASVADVAAEFDLAKSTVSEHLRTVTAALFSQTFGDGS
ncbi:helix-turn-helix domain-containing protein [Halorubrum sp. HHNYT27]|uniref:helix-turn-helix domain-containing protein n=1 Tax=Halorubrum sp. HHNYT27 TaxID=3402275 RepID=UPI003EB8277E